MMERGVRDDGDGVVREIGEEKGGPKGKRKEG